jgi:hypothetical protein
LRLGIPTASEFPKIVTPTGKLSEQARKYAHLLVAEQLLGRPLISLDELEWVARGKELEPEAARLYEFDRDVDTEPVGFLTTDDGRIGASPDRLVGKPGVLEIKAPAPQTHVGYVLDGFAEKYKPQVQGQLLVSDREWCDWMSYHPELPPIIDRVHRDEVFIGRLRDALNVFCDMLDAMRERTRSIGIVPYVARQIPKPEQPASPSLAETIRLNETAMRMHAP